MHKGQELGDSECQLHLQGQHSKEYGRYMQENEHLRSGIAPAVL
jgi:hypothetical protein